MTTIFRDLNPNYTIVPSPTSTLERQNQQMVPSSFPFSGHSPGTPMVHPTGPQSRATGDATTTTTTTATTTGAGSKGKGTGQKRKEREETGSGDEGASKKRAKTKKVSEEKMKKMSVRKKLMKQFLREMQIYSNKAKEPWYEFASLYVAAMGGLVKVDDLIACYPYDFYAPTLWEKRYLLKSGKTPSSSSSLMMQSGGNNGPVDLNAEEAEEIARMDQEERKGTGKTRRLDLEKLDEKLKAVDVLAEHIKELVGRDFRQYAQTSSLDAALRAASRFVLDALVRREIKQEHAERTEEAEREYMEELERRKRQVEIDDEEEEEERGSKHGRSSSSSRSLSTTTTKRFDERDASKNYRLTSPLKSKIMNLKFLVKKEAEKLSRIGPVSRGGIALDVDLDDNILYPSLGGDANGDEDDDNEEYMDEIAKTMGMNVFNPEFKGLLIVCTDDINGLTDAPNRNFTSFELCTSPIVRSQFAKFMALCTSPVNNKFSTKTPFATQSYASNYGGGNTNGNTIIIQPSQTRYIMAANKTEIMAMYRFFETVRRSHDGTLVIPSKHPQQRTRNNSYANAYGNRTDTPDEYDEDEVFSSSPHSSYFSFGGRPTKKSTSYFSPDKSRFGSNSRVPIEFVL